MRRKCVWWRYTVRKDMKRRTHNATQQIKKSNPRHKKIQRCSPTKLSCVRAKNKMKIEEGSKIYYVHFFHHITTIIMSFLYDMRVHMHYTGCTEKHKYTFTEKKIFMIAFLLYLHLFPLVLH